MKKKIIISVLVVAGLLLWAAPIKAADSKDVIIGTIIGGIIGSEIQKDKQKSQQYICLLYTSPSPRDRTRSRMPSSA